MTRMNTTEANAGLDLAHLAKCITPTGSLNSTYIGEHFNGTPGWASIAVEVLRLTALVADLTAANAALAADNARMAKREEEARRLINPMVQGDGVVQFVEWTKSARAWLAGGDA